MKGGQTSTARNGQKELCHFLPCSILKWREEGNAGLKKERKKERKKEDETISQDAMGQKSKQPDVTMKTQGAIISQTLHQLKSDAPQQEHG